MDPVLHAIYNMEYRQRTSALAQYTQSRYTIFFYTSGNYYKLESFSQKNVRGVFSNKWIWKG